MKCEVENFIFFALSRQEKGAKEYALITSVYSAY
jgi:hypothetical protein